MTDAEMIAALRAENDTLRSTVAGYRLLLAVVGEDVRALAATVASRMDPVLAAEPFPVRQP